MPDVSRHEVARHVAIVGLLRGKHLMPAKTILSPQPAACLVRPPRPYDFERMAELAQQLGYLCSAEQIRARLAQMQNSQQNAVFVAQAADGKIVGWIGAQVFRCVELDPFAEITGLVVDEQSRSCGIGKLLVAAAEQWARSVGSRVLCVRCNVVRERAQRFYTANGFEEIKVQKIFRKPLR